ncbi:unnamed protein product [Rhizoctonia solani]|uniref:Protein kinase domain-containing protein n=1 Tax=Rhizoctonia solani TaxID=456999 RepID=A0A8H3BMG1_9AGAM|nr:unnamed protein product [Rhizoctonia solani]
MSQLKISKHLTGPIVHVGHANVVHAVAFSPDGNSVSSGSMDRTVRTWDAYSPISKDEAYRGHTRGVSSVSYSPSSDLIASGSHDHTIRLWSTDTGKQVGDPLQGHTAIVNSVYFSFSGKFIVSGSNDNVVRLWDVQNRPSSNSFSGHYGRVNSVGFSPEGAYITSGSDDTTVRVWDVERRSNMGLFRGHVGPVRSIAYSPDGSQIASASSDNTIRLWDARVGGTVSKSYEGHTGCVCAVTFSPSSLFLASGSYDQTIRIWDLRTGALVIDPIEGHTGYVYSVAFSPSGEQLVSGSNDGKVIVWSIFEKNSDEKHEIEASNKDRDDSLKVENEERIGRDTSIKEVFNLLLRHGCVAFDSQMDSRQDSNVMVGGGGFGDIWASRLKSGAKVAVKVWRGYSIDQCDEKTLKRATREVYYWSRMNHQHVHRLLGVIIFRDQHLGMVSEWMENGNLREYMRKAPSFDRYEMCTSIASGLVYMHECNAVHGDLKAASNSYNIKPGQLIITSHNLQQPNVLVSSDGVAKLADFGLSTISEASLGFSDTSNPQIGSTRWAAPELLFDDALKSKESDVYALGTTMLEVITGEVPYPQYQSDYQVVAKVMQGIQPTRPTVQLRDDNRGDQIWTLLLGCWSREFAARPSAQQVLESVRSMLF